MDDCTVRIIKLMQEEGMNAFQFSNAIGIKRATMSNIMSGKYNPSLDVIKKVLDKFYTINPSWLIQGIGPMRLNTDNYSRKNDNSYIDNDVIGHNSVNNPKIDNSLFDKNDLDFFSKPINKSINTTETPQEEDIRPEINFIDKNIKGEVINKLRRNIEEPEKEAIMYKERYLKTIDKLLIFYSDNTFESFIPEKK